MVWNHLPNIGTATFIYIPVWFITCQNFYFGKFVRLTVCLSVCLSGWIITHNSRTHWHIFTKLQTQMHLVQCSPLCIFKFKGQMSRSLGHKIDQDGYMRQIQHTCQCVNCAKVRIISRAFSLMHSCADETLIVRQNFCLLFESLNIQTKIYTPSMKSEVLVNGLFENF